MVILFSNRWIGMERKHNKALGDCPISKYNEKKRKEERRKEEDGKEDYIVCTCMC